MITQVDEDVFFVAQIYRLHAVEVGRLDLSRGVISIYFHNSFELDSVFFVLDIQGQFQIFQVHIGRMFWDGITKQLVTILQNPKHPPRSGVISGCTCFLLHLVHFRSNVCLGRYLEIFHKIAQMQERGKGLRLAIEEKEVSELSEGQQVKGNSSCRLASTIG